MRLVAANYIERGWSPIPLKTGEEGKEPRDTNWPKRKYDQRTDWDGNVGNRLGKPSGGLVDVDCDVPEARLLSAAILPPTDARFQRPSTPDAHWLYKCPDPPGSTKQYLDLKKDGEKQHSIVELRSTGGQTMFPPSVHPCGERLTWASDGEPAEIAAGDLDLKVRWLATAALLLRYFPGEGSLWSGYKAMIGYLLRAGVDVPTVERIVRVLVMKFQSPLKRIRAVAVLKQRLDADGRKARVPGFTELKNVWGDEIAAKVKAWMPRNDADDDYFVHGGRLWTYDTIGKPVSLANFSAEIIEDQTVDEGADDGAQLARRLRIKGTMSDGTSLPTVVLRSEDFKNTEWVLREWGAKAVVKVGVGVKHLNVAIQSVAENVVERQVYAHLGWRQINGKWLYLHAGGAIGARGPVEGVDVEVDGELARFQLPAAIRDIQAAVRASLEFSDVNRLMASAAWRAPLQHWYPMPVSPYQAGGTGVLKSATQAVAQSHWGTSFDGVRFAANWSSSANRLEKEAFIAKDCLWVVDDFKPTGNSHDVRGYHAKAETLFRGAANQGGRGRMRPDTTSRTTYYPRALAAASGEDVPTGHSLRARLLIEQFGPHTIDPVKLARTQAYAKDGMLAEAMAAYVSWLAERADAGHFGKLVAIPPPAGIEHRRTAEGVNAMLLGVQMFLDFAMTVGVIDRAELDRRYWIAHQALYGLAQVQNIEQQEEDEALVFIEAIPALLASGKAHVSDNQGNAPHDCGNPAALGWQHRATYVRRQDQDGGTEAVGDDWQPQGKRIGVLEDGHLLLFYMVAVREVQQMLGGSITLKTATLGKRLDEKGFIVEKEGGKENRVAKTKNIGGKNDRVWILDAGVAGIITGITGPRLPGV